MTWPDFFLALFRTIAVFAAGGWFGFLLAATVPCGVCGNRTKEQMIEELKRECRI
ncbi:MAG: hypothetical protein AAB538_05685 [Patescibacteria group bacterium]